MKMADLQHVGTGHKILILLRFAASLFEMYLYMVNFKCVSFSDNIQLHAV
jgi:hypothetical protein